MIDPSALRRALGSFVTGVTVITTRDKDGKDHGVTANSFNSVSLDPPLVLWSLARSSSSLAAFRDASHFAIHILACDQIDLSARFAKPAADKFEGATYSRGVDRVPLLDGCAARFVCRPAFAYDGGDHVIFVGEIVEHEHRPIAPLAFHEGKYAVTAHRTAAEEADAEALTLLLQSSFFHLLTPMRDTRAALSIGLHEHYMMNALFANPDIDLRGINEIIGYTGVTVDADVAKNLEGQGHIVGEGKGELARKYRLTEKGRKAVVKLMAASAVKETELNSIISDGEVSILRNLLIRLRDGLAVKSPESVRRHMELLKSIPSETM